MNDIKNIHATNDSVKHIKKQESDLSELELKFKWDKNRAATQTLSDFLFYKQNKQNNKHLKWATRMSNCANILTLKKENDKIKFDRAFFCHFRHCQLCDARRSLKRIAQFKSLIDSFDVSNNRWILLTLTVPNCPVKELRDTIKRMNDAWHRFIKRKQFKHVLGFVKSIEVTQEANRSGYAHPHFHVLLLVPPSMFAANYVKQADWLQMWRDCYRDQTIVGVDVKAVKKADEGAVEVLKAFSYSVKIDELVHRSDDFMIEYMKQVESLKFTTAGGVLKYVFRDKIHVESEDITTEDCFKNEREKLDESPLYAKWRPFKKQYQLIKNEESS